MCVMANAGMIGREGYNPFIYKARDSSLAPVGFLMDQLL